VTSPFSHRNADFQKRSVALSPPPMPIVVQ
jgi:hypothetical protein